MSNKLLLTVDVTENSNKKEFFNYTAEASSILKEKIKDETVLDYKITEVTIGSNDRKITSTMEFSLEDDTKSVFDSKKYQKLLTVKEKIFPILNCKLEKSEW